MYLDKVAIDYLKHTDLSKIFTKYFVSEQTNKSINLKGSGDEFLEHREYHYGDELKNINWKLFAKTGKLYVKTFSSNVSKDVFIALDVSKSMSAGRKISKLEYSKYLLTVVAYKLTTLGYRVYFSAFDSKFYRLFSFDERNFSKIQDTLTNIDVNSETNFRGILKELPRFINSASNILFISDFLFITTEEIYKLRLLLPKNDIVFFHIVAEEEVSFPRENEFLEFIDPETSIKRVFSVSEIYNEYQDKLSKFFDNLYKATKDSKIPLITFNTSTPYYVILRQI
ncbi:MAG: DUF58 domain-containing protein [Brevinematia bacterium]